MKKSLYRLSLVAAFFVACTPFKTSSHGLDNQAFLQFIANPKNYPLPLDVQVDDKPSFSANVYEEIPGRAIGQAYAISPGSHNLKIRYNNRIVYQKQIFISAQETSKITLP